MDTVQTRTASFTQFSSLPPHSLHDIILKRNQDSKENIEKVYPLLNTRNVEPLTLLKKQTKKQTMGRQLGTKRNKTNFLKKGRGMGTQYYES